MRGAVLTHTVLAEPGTSVSEPEAVAEFGVVSNGGPCGASCMGVALSSCAEPEALAELGVVSKAQVMSMPCGLVL